jgi:phage antirepressor YoqD-like protein
MEKELTLFGNEVVGTDEEKFTTRQLAEQLNMDVKTVRENGKKCFPDKVFENGKTTYWTKPEAAAIIEYMKEHNNRTDLTCTTVVQATTTELTPALKIKKAMELMREGYEEELAILRAKNAEQAEKISSDAPKVDYYDRICNASGLVNIRQASKLLNIPEKKFIAALIESGYLYRDSCGTLTPYAGRAALFAVKEWTANGKAGIQTLITPEGLSHLLRRFGNIDNIKS